MSRRNPDTGGTGFGSDAIKNGRERMPLADKPLSELVTYRPPLTREADFDAFWDRTLAEAAQIPLDIHIEAIPDYPVPEIHASRLTFTGWAGARICGWWLVPPDSAPGAHNGKRPTMVFYHGYSGNKGYIDQYLGWVLQGYCVLTVDVRGQSGESTDPKAYPGGHATGWMTQGITDPDHYYYRGAYIDCVRALDAACAQPEVDPHRIGITGGSQGGALTLAVAALDPHRRAKVAMADVPYLSHFRRSVEIASAPPYTEIAVYCRQWPSREEQVYRTLSYFDCMNLADRIECPVLMQVGLTDIICPPSTIYAVYNHLRVATRHANVYPYNGHEGNPAHMYTKLAWARKHVFGA